jgi:microcystin-dependent protein
MSDIGNSVWNETDGSNTTAAPDGAPEGMAPSGVNDVLRAHQGAIKRWYNQTVPKTTGGTSTAYTLTYGVTPGALVDGMTHMVQFHAANGTAPTLNVNALGAIPIQYYSAGSWRSLPPSLFGTNWIAEVTYSSSAGAYRLIGFDNRTGIIELDGCYDSDVGTLQCYGQAVSRTTYAGLFSRFSTNYGGGDGSTTFNLPDMRGMVGVGRTDMGGSDRGNLTGGTVEAAQLGSQSAAISASGTASGSLTVTGSGTSGAPSDNTGLAGTGSGGFAPSLTHTHSVTITGTTSGTMAVSASGSGSTIQPSLVVQYVVRI